MKLRLLVITLIVYFQGAWTRAATSIHSLISRCV